MNVLSQDKFLTDVMYHFDPAFEPIVVPAYDLIETKRGAMTIAMAEDSYQTSRYFGGYVGGKLVSYLTISHPTLADDAVTPFWWVGYTIVERADRGAGYTRRLIEWWVQRHREPLMSDVGQTEEAQGVWTSMMMKEPVLDFEFWLRDDNDFRPIDVSGSKPAPNPWDGSPNRIVARPR